MCDIAKLLFIKANLLAFELLMDQKQQAARVFFLIVLKVIILSLIWYLASDMFVFFI